MAPEKTDFEESMKKLEQIVQEMESGELTLEKSIEKFEEGVKLAGICGKVLGDSEQKINELIKKNGDIFEQSAQGL
ncbi:MAG: exodeoxyribonuclease VII small subunit [Fibrobacterota bacterium]